MIFSSLIHAIKSRIATKLIIVVVILLSAVSILLTSFFITRQKKLLSDELYKRAHALAQNLAYNSRNYLLSTDRSIIQSFVSGVKEEPDIENVFLTDREGTILASTNTNTFTLRAKKMLTIPAVFDSTSPEKWFPGDNETIKRMIVPVEVEMPIVDTDNILYSSSKDNTDFHEILFTNHERFFFPSFNPSGDEITHTVVFRYEGSLAVMSASIKNRSMRLLIGTGCNGFWSNNGRYLVFTDTEKDKLSVLDIETRTVKSLGVTYAVSRFTPDDNYIITSLMANEAEWKLFKVPRDGGESEQLTFHKGDHYYPDCSPDGNWIMYTEFSQKTLYVYNTETKESMPLFPDMQVNNICGSFSPDGSRFCYIREVANGQDVYIADFYSEDDQLSKDNVYGTRLTFTGGYKWFTDWSPDNKWIVYSHADTRWHQLNVWIVPSQGGDPINLTGSVQTYKNKIGYSVLDVSTEKLNRAIAEGNRTALIITLLFTSIGIFCAFVLMRNIVRPVQNIAHVAGEIAGGNLDHKISTQRSDEIGVLADSFDRMMHQLKILIDEKDERNRELQEAYKELETLDQAKDDFLSLVSHELRTPLSSLLVFSEMLLNNVVGSEETRAEIHTTMVEECKRLTRLISDVLDLSKIEAGRMLFHPEALNIRNLIGDTLTRLNPIINGKSIHFDYNNIPGDIYLRGDRDKIIQVLENIISNALKFTPEDGSITVSLTTGNDEGIIAVRDTGKGIPKEDIPKVFDRFIQLESIEHHAGGTGLGMTISKSIVERLEGRIWIESDVGSGTTVFFTLPVAERSEQELPVDQNIESVPAINNIKSNNSYAEKILIVDDEKSIRLALTECLKSAGFSTIEVPGGREALRIARKHRPPLIILDVMLPDVSGLDICSTLKNDPKTSGIKIIMLSARGQEKEKEEGLKAGADRYITKPFNYQHLLETIEELLKK